MLDESYDWRKAAAMASNDSPSAEEVEQAFMDLAYNYISQKAGPLLEDPFRLGFEVVYTNDDNTRMAGMFAFRVGKSLLSVPCFFMDGAVKGTELLYQHKRKLFCPLTDDWTRHLVSRNRTENEGRGQNKEMTNKIHPGMRLERLAQPQFMKRASFAFEFLEQAMQESPDDVRGWLQAKAENEPDYALDVAKALQVLDEEEALSPQAVGAVPEPSMSLPPTMKRASAENSHLWKEAFDAIDSHATAPDTGSPEPVLADFLRSTEGAMTKLAAAIESSFDVATLIAHLPDESWDVEPDLVKSASDNEPDLIVYYDNFEGIKSASGHEGFRRGFYVLDTRPETDLNVVMCKAESEVTEVNDPGFHDIVCADGKLRRVFLGKQKKDDRYPSPYSHKETERNNVLIFADDNSRCVPHGPIFGTPADDCIDGTKDLPELPDKGGYSIFNCNTGELSCPIHVTKTTKRSDGVTLITYKKDHSSEEDIAYYNPDATTITLPEDCGCGEGVVLGPCCKFIKTDMKACSYDKDRHEATTSKYKPGTMEHYWGFLADNGVQQVSLESNEESFDGNKYTIQAGDIKCDTIDGPQTVVKLAHAFNIAADDASELLDAANASGSVEFLVFLDQGLTKVATQVRIVDSPDYREEYDQDLNIRTDSPQNFTLRSETTQPTPPARRLGDAYNPNPPENALASKEAVKAGLTDEDILNGNPDELAQFAQQSGTRNMVDHGVVGMLINTYDASVMVAKYIPRLEEGLDHFGRLIFLFHWKPADFEKLYGSDDMSNIESNLISQFISFGDILLELIKRNDDIDGSAQM